ncbi:hypothetical protein V6N11_084348 [Hibiscus sabdariffa]|uniref:Uncharacterized protein n=1 Tax=Hibiscus sabdariffa TaxID=183260 RepID=A0ABR2QSS3_9ROSI
MPVCPCVTSLTGGGWFFDVQFCLAAPWWRYGVLLAAPWWPWAASTAAPGWPWAVLWAASWWLQLVFVQPVLLARRMPQGAWLWPPLGLCPPLQHSCAILYPRSDMGLLCALSSWPNALACSTVVGAGMLAWCAHTSMPMPLFVRPALRLFDALAVGSMLPRPVAATSGLLDCFAWHPSLVEFHWVSPFSSTWGLMLVATRAPFDCPCSLGCARLQCVSWCYWPPIPWPRSGCWVCPGPWFALLPLLDYGASAPMVRFVPMAVVGCLRGGYSMVRRLVLPLALTLDLFTDCRILYRNVPSARPRERVEGQKFQYGAWLRAPLPKRSATRPRGRLALVADDHEATEVADPADSVLDPPGLASETSAQSDPAGPEVRADPNAEVWVNPSVAPTATAPAALEVRTDPTSAVRTNPTVAPVVQTGPMAPAVAAPVVRKGPAVPATAAPAVRKGQAVPATAAPMVRKGQAVPATTAPMVRKGQTVPTTAATALRTDLPVPNIVAPVVRTPQRAADSPPAPLVPLETDAMVEDVVDEDSSGQNLVADGSLPDDAPYNPLVHAETSAMLEEALEISRDCVLLADMDGVLQADGEDLVNEAIPEAADSIIREVAAKILGADAPSDGSDPPIALAKMGPSPSASPPKSGLSKSAPAGLRRAAMPVVPEHQEFDEWCAARSRTPPANVAAHPSEARASSIPPPRPHKRQAPSSDPLRAKRSRASASSSSRIPSSTKAGMSSVNNSPAETARQSRREK